MQQVNSSARLPLPEIYKQKLKADWGDMKNVGGRAAGSITAALFLSEFVTNTKWAHIDIAGPAFGQAIPTFRERWNRRYGRNPRSLDRILRLDTKQ